MPQNTAASNSVAESGNTLPHTVKRPAALLPLGALVAGMTLTAPALAQTAPAAEERLPEVKVQAERERSREAKGYQGGSTSVGKMRQAPKDIPQSVTVVSEQLIYDRNADTLREALRNVAGLTFNAGEGGRIGDNITLRGYSAVGDLYLDGIRDVAQYNRETFNLEQIDILRGSASMLFGRGSTGGVINQVSKQPFLSNQGEANLTVGSYDYKRLTADLNRVVGQDAAFRLNAMATDTDSFRDHVNQKRVGVAPSLRLGAGTANEFLLSYYYLKDDNVPDYGVPYFNGRPLQVPVERFYGMANADHEKNETGIATLGYTHRFDRDTQITTRLRAADYERDLWAVAPRLVLSNTGALTDVMRRQPQRRGSEENTLVSATDFTTKFETGSLKHEFLAGLELLRENSTRWSNVAGANPNASVSNPDANPALPAAYYNVTRAWQANYQARTTGVYAQDIIQFAPQWKVLLGLRHDDMKADYQRATGGDLSRTDRVWSYRTGLMFQPAENVNYYVAYGSSFNPSAELYQLDDRSSNTAPEKNRNVEIGAKWDLADGNLSLRTSLSRSEKTNERNTDLAMPNVFLLSGKRHTDALEFEAAGRITPQWEVFGAVALMKAKVDKASGQQGPNQGKVPVNTPDYTFSLWSTYKIGNWKFGGGLEAVDDRYGNATNTNVVPKYHRIDALVEYNLDRYSVKLNVLNLLNKDYYEGVYTGHVIPGTKRAIQLTLSTRF